MMITKKITVRGMTCNHCVGRVTEAIERLPGVESVNISLEENSATIRFDETKVNIEKSA